MAKRFLTASKLISVHGSNIKMTSLHLFNWWNSSLKEDVIATILPQIFVSKAANLELNIGLFIV